MKINTSIGYRIAWISMSLLLAACGGGGYSGDTTPSTPPIAGATGLDRFLLFPNPQAEPDKPDGPFQTDTEAYARAYYEAIDGMNDKDTLAKWKAANKFDDPSGTKVTAVFGDKRDLGYGRHMTARHDPSKKTIAFLVENYVVNPGEAYGYSPLSLEAAVAQDARWRIGINAIEFSPGPKGGASFAKFFNFNPQTGQRELMVDLDFRGAKAMPGPCITCHGGRGDRLKADESFPLIQNTASKTAGDVQAHLAPFEVDSLDFLNIPGFTKNDQEEVLKLMNQMVLCTYPLPSSSVVETASCDGLPGATRRKAKPSEWEATAAAKLITAAYVQNGAASNIYKEPPVPEDWVNAGQSSLYTEVVVPACRMCHMLRGTGVESDIDFETYEEFRSYVDRIKVHVFDRGNMPLAKLVYDNFWASNGPAILATFLENQSPTLTVRDPLTLALLKPGRPIADPGPNRVILGLNPPLQPARAKVTARLSGANSLFASTYSWTQVANPNGGSSLVDPTSVTPTFEATKDGIYVVQLVVSNASASSQPVLLSINVKSDLPQKDVVRFSDVVDVLQNNLGDPCTDCHKSASLTLTPVFYDSPSYEEIRSRVNFTNIFASPLLRKPAGDHHGAGAAPRDQFNVLISAPGDPQRENYDLFLNWILNGAPK